MVGWVRGLVGWLVEWSWAFFPKSFFSDLVPGKEKVRKLEHRYLFTAREAIVSDVKPQVDKYEEGHYFTQIGTVGLPSSPNASALEDAAGRGAKPPDTGPVTGPPGKQQQGEEGSQGSQSRRKSRLFARRSHTWGQSLPSQRAERCVNAKQNHATRGQTDRHTDRQAC